MLPTLEVKNVVRTFLKKCNPHREGFVAPDIGEEMSRLASASNIDIRSALLEEFSGESEFESLLAARTYIHMFRYDERVRLAIDVFRRSLASESVPSHSDALSLLMGIKNMPDDLMPSIRLHLTEGSPSRLGAAIVATEFDELRVEACGIVGQLLKSDEFGDNAKFLAALRMIRLNYGVDAAWNILDEVHSRLPDPDFRFSCLAALVGIESQPDKKTIDRLVLWAIETESATFNRPVTEKLMLLELFAGIKTPDERIDTFLLRSINASRTDHIFAAANALTLRMSKIGKQAQLEIANLLVSSEIRIREVGATCMLRCFDEVSDDVVAIVTSRLMIERDLEVIELLMRICEKVGYRAFRSLFQEWKNPINLRGWIQTWTLGVLGLESFEEVFRVVIENPGSESSRLLALTIMGARLSNPELMQDILEKLSSLDGDELETILIALQNSDSNAAFLVPQLLPIATSDSNLRFAEHASKVIHSIGKAGLIYFPCSDNENPNSPLAKLRRLIESDGANGETSILDGIRARPLERYSEAARLLASGDCRSIKEAAKVLADRFKNTKQSKGWSEQSIKRAKKQLEDFLSDKWQRSVTLLEITSNSSTSPSKLTDEGLRVLDMIEQYLERRDQLS